MDVTRRGLYLAAKGLAVLVMICLVRCADIFVLIFSFNQVGIVPSTIALLVLLSGAGAIIGLIRGNRWGFLPLYFFIPAVTLFFNDSLIPYLPQLFSPLNREVVVFALNGSVLLFSVLLLLKMMDRDVIFSVEKY